MKIFKYPLELTDAQVLQLPAGAKPLHVDDQQGQLCLWAAVDPSRETKPYAVAIVGTGHDLPDVLAIKHLGSVQQGSFVWHVFGGFDA